MRHESELSILLIEDDADSAQLIDHILSSGGGSFTVEWARDLGSGLARLVEKDFQAVLLDLNLPDSSGFDTFARIQQEAQESAVVVLTGQDDEGLGLQAMRAGADEFLLKSDIRDRFLLHRIRYAIERSRLKQQCAARRVNGKVFSFIGSKGGAGTSTLAINLAAALAKDGETVIAIELAPEYGSFSVLLNRAPIRDISTLLRVGPEASTRRAVTQCLEDFGGGFRALCGPPRMEDPISPDHVRVLLEVARGMADYTLIDMPNLSAPSSLEAIRHSELTTLVLERNRMGLHSALGKMTALQDAASGAVAAVINSKSPFAEFLTVPEFGQRLGCSIVGVIPPAPDLNAAAVSEPFLVLSRPDIPFSSSIREVASWLKRLPGRIMAA